MPSLIEKAIDSSIACLTYEDRYFLVDEGFEWEGDRNKWVFRKNYGIHVIRVTVNEDGSIHVRIREGVAGKPVHTPIEFNSTNFRTKYLEAIKVLDDFFNKK